jgi:hypothetical protein
MIADDLPPPEELCEADKWQLYEARKREWLACHRRATPAEYELALKRICDELRL